MGLNLVGIAGRAGAGKDTAADVLVKEFGFVKVALADPIKRLVRSLWDWPEEALWGPSEFRNVPDPRYGGLTPRKALQHIGTEIGRELDPRLWIRMALETTEALLEEPELLDYDRTTGLFWHPEDAPPPVTKGVVWPDVRFPNEVEAIRAAGGRIWKIERSFDSISANEAFRQHVSEAHVDGIEADSVIDNTSTLEEFHRQINIAAIFHQQHR